MKTTCTLLCGAAGAVLVVADASAADLPVSLVSPPGPPPMTAPAFDWSGPYVGAYAGWNFDNAFGMAGAQTGLNIVRGSFLAGVEAQIGVGFPLGPFLVADLNGRLGLLLGGRAILYGEAGIGLSAGLAVWTVGGGLEFAIGDALSLVGEAKALFEFPAVFEGITLQAGLNWHPGN